MQHLVFGGMCCYVLAALQIDLHHQDRNFALFLEQKLHDTGFEVWLDTNPTLRWAAHETRLEIRAQQRKRNFWTRREWN